jgi:DNA polymerase-3 subunit epsilon
MSWFNRLFNGLRNPSQEESAAIATYHRLPSPDKAQSVLETRFVVLDVESSGLNPFRDRLLSIGAVVVREGTIRVGEAFELVLRQDAPSDHQNILIHGIDGATQVGGRDPREALLEFLAYAGKAPLVGYHVDFDRVMIERAMKRALGVKPDNEWLDLARLLPALFPNQAARGRGLDYWLGVFSIENFARHAALADAFATAQLLLVALPRSVSTGYVYYADLCRLNDDQRWLERNQPRPR